MLELVDGWWRIKGDRGFEVFRHEYSQPLPFNIDMNDVVVDLGANVGIFTRLALDAGARVIAVEAMPEPFEALCKNCPGAKLVRAAAYDIDNSSLIIQFDHQDSGKASAILPVSDETVEVRTVTVDRLLAGERVTVIKMDIEGCEERALRGAEKSIRKWKPKMLVSIEHLPSDLERLSVVIDSIQPGYVKTEMASRGPGDRTLYCEWRES